MIVTRLLIAWVYTTLEIFGEETRRDSAQKMFDGDGTDEDNAQKIFVWREVSTGVLEPARGSNRDTLDISLFEV